MGWYGLTNNEIYYKSNGLEIDRKKTMDEYLKENLVYSALINSTYYAAMKGKEGEIYGLVCLTTVDRGEFMYKPISEDMGPFYYNCPNTVLKRLTPTTNSFALKWREQCQILADFKKKLNKHPPKIKFTCPYDMGEEYKKGDEIILHYHTIILPYKNRVKGFYTDGTYRFPGKYLTIDTVNFID